MVSNVRWKVVVLASMVLFCSTKMSRAQIVHTSIDALPAAGNDKGERSFIWKFKATAPFPDFHNMTFFSPWIPSSTVVDGEKKLILEAKHVEGPHSVGEGDAQDDVDPGAKIKIEIADVTALAPVVQPTELTRKVAVHLTNGEENHSDLYKVAYNGNGVAAWEFVFTGLHLEKPVKAPDPEKTGGSSGYSSGMSYTPAGPGAGTLSFFDVFLSDLRLSGGVPNVGDPVAGAELVIGAISLVEQDTETGHATFSSTTVQLTDGMNTFFTAELVNPFLFNGLNEPFDSELFAELSNIVIDNSIGSSYLSSLQSSIAAGDSQILVFDTDIMGQTSGLVTSGSSAGVAHVAAAQEPIAVPEPTTCVLLLTAALASAAFRKSSR